MGQNPDDFYSGTDLIDNEIGTVNVVVIAAEMLGRFDLSSLKKAMMARETNEVARLIHSYSYRR